MRCKTMLLGGAVALALSGAAYAQTQASPQAAPGTDQINAGAAAGTARVYAVAGVQGIASAYESAATSAQFETGIAGRMQFAGDRPFRSSVATECLLCRGCVRLPDGS